MGLQLLADRGHVVGVEQVTLDVAVETVPGGDLLGGLGVADARGAQLELAVGGLAVPDLGEADVVREHQLDLARLRAAQEAGLLGGVADLLAVLVDHPRAREVVQEGTAVLLEDHLLAVLERLDRRVVAVAVADPAAEQPGDGSTVRVQVGRKLERHRSSVTTTCS